MSIPNTEAIMAALFALGQSVNTPSTPFKVATRRMRNFPDVPSGEIPAFFQFQAPGFTIGEGVRGLQVYRRKVYWIVYLPGSAGINDVVSPTMNKYYDAMLNALQPTGADMIQRRNTLGGLCTNCYADGQGITDEGLLTTPSLIVIPITILTGF